MPLPTLSKSGLQQAVAAWDSRASRATGVQGRAMRRVGKNRPALEFLLRRKFEQFARANPNKGAAEILAMLIEWINGGGLVKIAEFIALIMQIFSIVLMFGVSFYRLIV